MQKKEGRKKSSKDRFTTKTGQYTKSSVKGKGKEKKNKCEIAAPRLEKTPLAEGRLKKKEEKPTKGVNSKKTYKTRTIPYASSDYKGDARVYL